MTILDNIVNMDADLGSAFISSKEIRVKFSGDDLKELYAIDWSTVHSQLSNKQKALVKELFDEILEGVCNYTLV